jgi:hypothetical protein
MNTEVTAWRRTVLEKLRVDQPIDKIFSVLG